MTSRSWRFSFCSRWASRPVFEYRHVGIRSLVGGVVGDTSPPPDRPAAAGPGPGAGTPPARPGHRPARAGEPGHAVAAAFDVVAVLGAVTLHLASMAAEALVRRVWNFELSNRVIRLARRLASLVSPALLAWAWAAVSLGSPAAIRASPLSMRVSILVALAQLKWLMAWVPGTVAAPAMPAVPKDNAPTATAPITNFLAVGMMNMMCYLLSDAGRSGDSLRYRCLSCAI